MAAPGNPSRPAAFHLAGLIGIGLLCACASGSGPDPKAEVEEVGEWDPWEGMEPARVRRQRGRRGSLVPRARSVWAGASCPRRRCACTSISSCATWSSVPLRQPAAAGRSQAGDARDRPLHRQHDRRDRRLLRPRHRHGLTTREEDLGQTLGYWGVGGGPYLVIPFWDGPTRATPPADWAAPR